jgi:hypothetical protein
LEAGLRESKGRALGAKSIIVELFMPNVMEDWLRIEDFTADLSSKKGPSNLYLALSAPSL